MYIPNGVKEASDILAQSSKFVVYYDPDVDGLMAGYLAQRFLTLFNFSSHYFINENRAHGFKMVDELIEKLRGYTVIAVDFEMTREELVNLTDAGVNVINIDHHNINENELVYVESPSTKCRGVIINNQYPFEPEEYRFLSGAGVVYYVLKALYPKFCREDEKALVGISLLSDIRPIENPIAEDFLTTTYNHKSPLIDYLLEVTKNRTDFGFGVQTLDRNYIDYTFSPKLNALFRLNKGDSAIDIINGRYPLENYLEEFKRMQNTAIDNIMEGLRGNEYSNLIVKSIGADVEVLPGFDACNFIGVTCSRVKNLGKTTFLFVTDGEKIKRGSVRGLYDGVDYLSLFRKHGLNGKGHKNAFGVLESDLSAIDFEALNAEVEALERQGSQVQYDGRIVDVPNLAMFTRGKNIEIARKNIYVRDSNRFYLRYTGSNYKRVQKGRMWEYIIDGIAVKCFDEELNLENGLILPLLERGNYIQFYLRKKL